LLQDLPVVSEVRGKGLMIGIELVDANQNNLETMRTSTIVRLVKERGILIGKISHAVDESENIIFIAPPLILTLDEADRIFETLKDVLTSSSY
jgi:4-aminobutyrate aminotransferase-like enzyme